MGLHADQDVLEIGHRVDVLESTCGDDGLEDGEVLTGVGVTNEEEILAPGGDDSEFALGQVVVERNGRIGEEVLEGHALVLGVGQRLAHVGLGTVLVDLVEDLAVELVDDLLAVRRAPPGVAEVAYTDSARPLLS